MSILKRVLSDAVASLLGKARPNKTVNSRDTETRNTDKVDAQMYYPPASTVSQFGRIGVILSWKGGENDPFTVVSATMRQHFLACGKNVEVIEISDGTWPTRLMELPPGSVDFALTWQGLGSRATVGARGESLWDHLKIPLVCIHGDHPSHMPPNHQLESRYCFHMYTNAEFARYSNRHFRRMRSASVIDIPQIHLEDRLDRRAGDHFVIAKNINDPIDTENRWRQQLTKTAFDAHMMAAEALKSQIALEATVDVHDALDDLIYKNNLEWLTPKANVAGFHQFHSQLDHYLRSHKSVIMLEAIRDFPVHIYGRGWERIAQQASPSHVFFPARNMSDSQDLYYSRFGVIDISPAKGLHDRTRRAMANGSSFLSSANLGDSFADIRRFDALFFSFRTPELADKCAAVLKDPAYHLELAQQFADHYHNRYHFKDFVRQIDVLAKLAGRTV